MKKLNFDKSADKMLNRLDKPTRHRVVNAILGLLDEPPKGDIKSLKGELRGLHRLRIGNWRVTYEATEESINILSVTSRGGAYKKGV
ncbi:MAG: type II toxin-antitoxin system RelE/ParE family toxin [Clostridiales bacterium]|jgi:mRNA interferase RelE/StbE|nr:type II toxin-antitoxin system RelE/ParE family toxin [Clostridiales bacterium]